MFFSDKWFLFPKGIFFQNSCSLGFFIHFVIKKWIYKVDIYMCITFFCVFMCVCVPVFLIESSIISFFSSVCIFWVFNMSFFLLSTSFGKQRHAFFFLKDFFSAKLLLKLLLVSVPAAVSPLLLWTVTLSSSLISSSIWSSSSPTLADRSVAAAMLLLLLLPEVLAASAVAAVSSWGDDDDTPSLPLPLPPPCVCWWRLKLAESL